MLFIDDTSACLCLWRTYNYCLAYKVFDAATCYVPHHRLGMYYDHRACMYYDHSACTSNAHEPYDPNLCQVSASQRFWKAKKGAKTNPKEGSLRIACLILHLSNFLLAARPSALLVFVCQCFYLVSGKDISKIFACRPKSTVLPMTWKGGWDYGEALLVRAVWGLDHTTYTTPY